MDFWFSCSSRFTIGILYPGDDEHQFDEIAVNSMSYKISKSGKANDEKKNAIKISMRSFSLGSSGLERTRKK